MIRGTQGHRLSTKTESVRLVPRERGVVSAEICVVLEATQGDAVKRACCLEPMTETFHVLILVSFTDHVP